MLVRGSNPIWTLFDLDGGLFDDTYYMFVLNNTIPYLPAMVWSDPQGNFPLDNPIEFLGNGTLPINIYFDDTQVYRLEFRKGNTQTDPLIYLVENYSPDGSGGVNPPSGIEIQTTNQITNPQFSEVNFTSPFTSTASTIDIAPGWQLVLSGGSGSVTVNQLTFTGDQNIVTNPSYGLSVSSPGWTQVQLIQTFNHNGALWANEAVAVSLTANCTTPGLTAEITASLVPSTGTIVPVLSGDLDSGYQEVQGSTDVGASTNSDDAPSAYTQLVIQWPGGTTVNITSIQIVGQTSPANVSYDQETIERQIDQTFHIYADSILMQPKESLTVGWNFGLNPWQFTAVAPANVATNTYTADQTVVVQQNYVAAAGGNNISVGQSGFATNYAFQATAVTATSQFAIINYIDPASIRPYWGYKMSSLLRAQFSTINSTVLKFKMRLIYRASLPSPISQTEPISSWTLNGDPTFAAGWTAITPRNDPSYTISSAITEVAFDGMQLPASSNANMILAVILYTTGDMNPAGTPDSVLIHDCSLCANDFAIQSPVLTFDDTLHQCQYYFEKSFSNATLPSATALGALAFPVNSWVNGGNTLYSYNSFSFGFNTIKRNATPLLTVYSPVSGSSGVVRVNTYLGATPETQAEISIGAWTVTTSSKGVNALITGVQIGPSVGTGVPSGYQSLQYTVGARLGILNET